MDDALKEDLSKLLQKHPDLRYATISFTDTDGSVSPGNTPASEQMSDAVTDTPLCQQEKPSPEIIRGPSTKVQVRKSAVHGYGVFAIEDIEAGELIEELRVLRLGLRKNYLHDDVLEDYVWAKDKCTCNDCITHGHVLYLALGFGSLYNHSDNPNTQMCRFLTGATVINATRRIEKGEEIFISYGKKYFLVRDFMKMVEKNKSLEQYLEAKKQPH